MIGNVAEATLFENLSGTPVSRGLEAELAARFATRPVLTVVQLGSDSNPRGRLSPLLPVAQTWFIADSLSEVGDDKADLVTASSFVSRLSVDAVRELVRTVTGSGAVFFASQIYGGVLRWTPRHPDDSRLMAAYHATLVRDRGFGPALGPTVAAHLADHFRLAGYTVIEAESGIDIFDQTLISGLAHKAADIAVAEKAIDAAGATAWRRRGKSALFARIDDLLALPG